MAKRRNLKKGINSICEMLMVDAVAATLYGADSQHADRDNALLHSLINIQRNYVNRVSHKEPGLSAKEYFRDLREKFSADINEAADHIRALWSPVAE